MEIFPIPAASSYQLLSIFIGPSNFFFLKEIGTKKLFFHGSENQVSDIYALSSLVAVILVVNPKICMK